jgi:hypothetical protein
MTCTGRTQLGGRLATRSCRQPSLPVNLPVCLSDDAPPELLGRRPRAKLCLECLRPLRRLLELALQRADVGVARLSQEPRLVLCCCQPLPQ